MGFTTGFVGGLTFTYSLLYLTIHLHRQNRIYQSTLLTQQRALLTSLYDPPSPEQTYTNPAYEIQKAGITEQLKDRWNRELETSLKRLAEKDWDATRVRVERGVGNLWGNIVGSDAGQEVIKKVEDVGQDVKEKVESAGQEVKRRAEAAAQEARKQAEAAAQEVKRQAEIAAQETKRKAEVAAREVKRKVTDAGHEVKRRVEGAGQEAKRQVEGITQEGKEALHEKRLLEL